MRIETTPLQASPARAYCKMHSAANTANTAEATRSGCSSGVLRCSSIIRRRGVRGGGVRMRRRYDLHCCCQHPLCASVAVAVAVVPPQTLQPVVVVRVASVVPLMDITTGQQRPPLVGILLVVTLLLLLLLLCRCLCRC
jgi:hypothetical protein